MAIRQTIITGSRKGWLAQVFYKRAPAGEGRVRVKSTATAPHRPLETSSRPE